MSMIRNQNVFFQSGKNATFGGDVRPPRVMHITAIDESVKLLLLNQLLYLKSQGFDVRVICSPGPNRQLIESHGISVYPVMLHRKITPLRDLVSLMAMTRILKRERIDVVHGHTLNGVLWGQLAGRLAGCPVVLQTVHGFYFHEYMPPIVHQIFLHVERIAALCSDAMLSQNQEDIATSLREGIGSRCKHRIHLGNGIDLGIFDPGRFTRKDRLTTRASFGFSEQDKVIIIIARLTRKKGFFELADAMRNIVKEHPDVKLLCVGPLDPESNGAFDPVVEGLDKEDWARFVGYRQDIPELLWASDIAVLPSYYEGYPRFLMESHAMGLASVATDVRGCREVIEPGVTGLLTRLGDVEGLARAITILLENDDQRRRFAQAARERALKFFDERKVFQIVADTYRELLAEKTCGRAQDE